MINAMLHTCQREVFTRFWHRYSFLSYEDVGNLAESLHSQVQASSDDFDVIISIDSGGRFVSNTLGKQLNIPVHGLKVDKYHVSFLGINLDDVVGAYKISQMMGLKIDINVTNNLKESVIANKSVLLLDDDSYTGDSMRAAIDAVSSKNPRLIRTGVLFQFGENSLINYSGMKISRENYIRTRPVMPWIKFSPYYDASLVGK